MDGITVTLEPAEKAKREDANQETNKGQQNSNPRDHIQKKIMNGVTVLQTQQRNRELHPHIAKLRKGLPSGSMNLITY